MLKALLRLAFPSLSDVLLVKEIQEGYSGASVLLCDISAPGDGVEGQYIVKLQTASSANTAALKNFRESLGNFGLERTPSIVRSVSHGDNALDVYEVAGHSLQHTISLENLEDIKDRDDTIRQSAGELLQAQLQHKTAVEYSKPVTAIMQDWIGAKIVTERSKQALEKICNQLEMHITDKLFLFEGELLPNPLIVMNRDLIPAGNVGVIYGTCHGDLHQKNVLVRGSRFTGDRTYWIIDASWPKPSPLLYDQAYLQLSLLHRGLQTVRNGRVTAILALVSQLQLQVPTQCDVNARVLAAELTSLEETTISVLQEIEDRRQDVWRIQYHLAKIAAGLNWSLKPLESLDLQKAAFIFAAWSCRDWLRQAHPEFWRQIIDSASTEAMRQTELADPAAESVIMQLWSTVQAPPPGTDLFLIADAIPADTALQSLGHVPWSAVVDLDSRSDVTGLAFSVMPTLEKTRHVSVFGENEQFVASTAATNWLMANGWETRGEAGQPDPQQWRWQDGLERVRRLIRNVADATSGTRASIVVIKTAVGDDRADKVVEYIEERYRGQRDVLDLSALSAGSGAEYVSILATIASSRPALTSNNVSLPSIAGRHVLLPADLHRLEVDLELLHSHILNPGTDSQIETDAFWRGRIPTWPELAAEIDISRDIYPSLMGNLRARLAEGRISVVTLYHSPGAGGTTLARRVAWDLRNQYPVALLRENFSENAGEGVAELHQLTGLPTVLIAEGSVLSEAEKDELLRDIAIHHGRAVILWVRRTNKQKGVSSRKNNELIDPMKPSEIQSFANEFLHRCSSSRGRERILDLRDSYVGSAIPVPMAVSPFYFGLCAYEERFLSLDQYVQVHLDKLSDDRYRIALYLGIVTLYGQVSLSVELVRRWLNAPQIHDSVYTDEDLLELLGHDLRHIVVQNRQGLRLMHPVIARRVLEFKRNNGVSFTVAQVADELIRKTLATLGPNAATATRLLSDLFIRRDSESANQFSDLIESLAIEEAQMVFKTLTELYPNEAHYWNHRGRYHIYRVRGDYPTAEKFLERAVSAAHEGRSTHLHTLGMVRRFWVEHEIREFQRSHQSGDSDALLASFRSVYESAMEAFSNARKESNTSHPWVTPIQLASVAVEALMRASGAGSLQELVASQSQTAEWAVEELHDAEGLLDIVRSMYADKVAERDYYAELSTDLGVLYGDIDQLVEQWRSIRPGGPKNMATDASLARALFVDGDRGWSDVSEARSRDIADLMWPAVEGGVASDADLRLWFQAYRRLPEYSESTALERLSWYARSRGSLDGAYYSYILQFLVWRRSASTALPQDRIREYLDICRRLSVARRQDWSYEWVRVDNFSGELVHFSELGRWNRDPHVVWSNPAPLARVTGVIEDLDPPHSGTIKVEDGKLTAWFNPRDEFLSSRDINQVVGFYLGFSYAGLRAWKVEKADSLSERHLRSEGDGRPRHQLRGDPLPAASHTGRGRASESRREDVTAVGQGVTLNPAVLADHQQQFARGSIEFDVYSLIRNFVGETEEREPAVLHSSILGTMLLQQLGRLRYSQFKRGGLREAIERIGLKTSAAGSGFTVHT